MKASLEEEATEHGQTLSEYLRALIEQRHEETVDASEYERLRDEYEELRGEVERLEREKQQILAQQQEHSELVRYVQDERTLSMKRHNASAAQRIKWLLFGDDEEE